MPLLLPAKLVQTPFVLTCLASPERWKSLSPELEADSDRRGALDELFAVVIPPQLWERRLLLENPPGSEWIAR